MVIRIDETAGFCPGVKRAIKLVEQQIQSGEQLIALGSLIHNDREIERLNQIGLIFIDQNEFEAGNFDKNQISDKKLFIRAHGISPQLRRRIENENLSYLDGTCGLVRKSQRIAKEFYEKGYQIVIVGKKNHPEVRGIIGFCNNEGAVVYNPGDEDELIFGDKVLLMAQTTIDAEKFKYFVERIKERVPDLIVKNTICPVVTKRQVHVKEFARSNDVIIFVADPGSSNSQVLYNLAKFENPRSYFLTRPEELKIEWFEGMKTVGITGGASTPRWQLEEFKKQITELLTP